MGWLKKILTVAAVVAIGWVAAPFLAAGGLIGAAANFALSYVINKAFGPDTPDAPKDQGVKQRLGADTKNKLPVVYGQKRVAGMIIMADISSDNQEMAFIVALCEGPVKGITGVTWDDKVLSFAGDVNTGLRNVSDAKDLDDESHDFLNDGRCSIRVYPGGGRCSEMEGFSSKWAANAANRKMPNVAYAYIKIKYDREKSLSGLTGNLRFDVMGRTVKTIDSITSISASEVYSDNPAEILLDYLTNETYGCKLPLAQIDLPSLHSHKEFCGGGTGVAQVLSVASVDTININSNNGGVLGFFMSKLIRGGDYSKLDFNVLMLAKLAVGGIFGGTSGLSSWLDTIYDRIKGGIDSTQTVPVVEQIDSNSVFLGNRYTTNGVVNTNSDMDYVITDLTIGNSASFTWTLGRFGVITDFVKSSIAHFSEENIVGNLQITGTGFNNKINELTVRYDSIHDRDNEDQIILNVPASNMNDNEPYLENTITLPYTNNNVEARRVGTVLINQSRQNLIARFQVTIEEYGIQAGDIITISHGTPGWVDKPFRIISVNETSAEGGIALDIVAHEYADEIYTDSVINEYDPAPNTSFPNPYATPAISGVTVVEDASVIEANLTVNWLDAGAVFNGDYLIGYKLATANDDTYQYKTITGRQRYSISPLIAEKNYTISVQPISVLGVEGETLYQAGTTGESRVADGKDGTPGKDGIYDIVAFRDSGTVPTISGGTVDLDTRSLSEYPDGWQGVPTDGVLSQRWKSRTTIDPTNLYEVIDKEKATFTEDSGITGGTDTAAVASVTRLGLTGVKAGSDLVSGAAEVVDLTMTGESGLSATSVYDEGEGLGSFRSGIAAAGNIAVAAGYSGNPSGAYIYYSDDNGQTWENANTSGTILSYYYPFAITSANDIFVISTYLYYSSSNRKGYTSTDGTTWVENTNLNFKFFDAIWTGTTYILLGSNRVYTTTDIQAGTFTSVVTTVNNYSVDEGFIGHGAGVTVIGGDDGEIQYSDDEGATWTVGTGTSSTSSVRSGAYGDSGFVILHEDNSISISTDGINWTQSAGAGPANSSYGGMAFGQGYYVAGNVAHTMYKSSTGLNWTQVNNNSVDGYPYGITWLNDTFISVTSEGAVITNTDIASSGFVVTRSSSTKSLYYTDVSDSGAWVSVGLLNGKTYISSDGISWSKGNNTPTVLTSIYAMKYLNGEFIAVGSGGKIVVSTDGVSWTELSIGTSSRLYGLDYIDGTYYFYTSSTTYTMTDITAANATSLSVISQARSITKSSGGTYVAVGVSRIYHSPDGTTWTAATTLPITKSWIKSLYVEDTDTWVAASGFRLADCLYSTDSGVTWNLLEYGSLSGSTSTRAANIINGVIVLAGYNTDLICSSDGINFTFLNDTDFLGSGNELKYTYGIIPRGGNSFWVGGQFLANAEITLSASDVITLDLDPTITTTNKTITLKPVTTSVNFGLQIQAFLEADATVENLEYATIEGGIRLIHALNGGVQDLLTNHTSSTNSTFALSNNIVTTGISSTAKEDTSIAWEGQAGIRAGTTYSYIEWEFGLTEMYQYTGGSSSSDYVGIPYSSSSTLTSLSSSVIGYATVTGDVFAAGLVAYYNSSTIFSDNWVASIGSSSNVFRITAKDSANRGFTNTSQYWMALRSSQSNSVTVTAYNSDDSVAITFSGSATTSDLYVRQDAAFSITGVEGSGALDSVSYLFDSAHASTALVLSDVPLNTTATEYAILENTFLATHITAGTLTGLVLSIRAGLNNLYATAGGDRADLAIVVTGGEGSTLEPTLTVHTEGSSGFTPLGTAARITANSSHSPNVAAFTFVNDALLSVALQRVLEVFTANDIGGYNLLTAIGSNDYFELVNDATGVDLPDLEFVITEVGTGGSLAAYATVITEGAVAYTSGTNTNTTTVAGVAYTTPFGVGIDGPARATAVYNTLNAVSAVTDDNNLVIDGDTWSIERKIFSDELDTTSIIDTGKVGQTTISPTVLRVQGVKAVLIWTTPAIDGKEGASAYGPSLAYDFSDSDTTPGVGVVYNSGNTITINRTGKSSLDNDDYLSGNVGIGDNIRISKDADNYILGIIDTKDVSDDDTVTYTITSKLVNGTISDNDTVAVSATAARDGYSGSSPTYQYWYTNSPGLRSEIGDPVNPGTGITWVDNTTSNLFPNTAYWYALQTTSGGTVSGIQVAQLKSKDAGIPFVTHAISRAGAAPTLVSAQWITDAIAAVESFTGRDYVSQKEFGYGTTVLITYTNTTPTPNTTTQVVGRLELDDSTTPASDVWVAPGKFIPGSLVVEKSITTDQLAANSVTASKVNLVAGDVNAGSTANSGARLNMTSNSIKFYNGSGDLVVNIEVT